MNVTDDDDTQANIYGNRIKRKLRMRYIDFEIGVEEDHSNGETLIVIEHDLTNIALAKTHRLIRQVGTDIVVLNGL